MSNLELEDLQESIQDKNAFQSLDDYYRITVEFLRYLKRARPTRIVSPSRSNYVFYQFPATYLNKITRPLNVDLYSNSIGSFQKHSKKFDKYLRFQKETRGKVARDSEFSSYLKSGFVNNVVYTIQQSIGCIGDSLENGNQARKRIGQLFESLVRLIIQAMGAECEGRTIKLPIPDFPGYTMSYELDIVFSRNRAIVTSETKYIEPYEIVGSIKTTSKDRLDKVFLDKYLLTKLLGRDIPVMAVFLHDVQRARRGKSIFGINSTFKTNHFLGYSVALNELDGVYYVDPRPEMKKDKRLSGLISDFQSFISRDFWEMTKA